MNNTTNVVVRAIHWRGADDKEPDYLADEEAEMNDGVELDVDLPCATRDHREGKKPVSYLSPAQHNSAKATAPDRVGLSVTALSTLTDGEDLSATQDRRCEAAPAVTPECGSHKHSAVRPRMMLEESCVPRYGASNVIHSSLEASRAEMCYWAANEAESGTVADGGTKKRRDGPRVSSNHCAKCRAIQSHILLDEYKYPPTGSCRGTPSVIAPSLRASDECPYRWMRPAENRGSISELAAHRDRHQVRNIHLHGYAVLNERWTRNARNALDLHRRHRMPERWEKDALVLSMSKEGATPGEWRLLQVFHESTGRHSRGPLNEARCGVRGAKTEFPGIGNKLDEDLRQHLALQVDELHIKHGINLPPICVPRPVQERSRNIRCRECTYVDRPLSVCIGQTPCAPCVQWGLCCGAREKLIPQARDVKRMTVLRKAAMKHLHQAAPGK